MRITREAIDFHQQIPAIAFIDYLKLFNNCVDYGYLIDGNCILPFIKRKRFLFYYIQLPTPVYGAKDELEEKKFLNNAILYLKKNIKSDYIISINTGISNTYPDGSIFCKFGTYILKLDKTEGELFAGLHSKHRNVIRKAQKDGLEVLHGKQYLYDCHKLINETFSRQGLLGPTKEYIERLSSLGDNIYFSIVKVGDEIHGSAIFLWSKNQSCFYLHGGSSEHTHAGAMNLLHWDTILWMRENDVKYYDFVGGRINPEEGSRLEGIQRFKSRFGGEFLVGYLWKYVINKYKYKLYCNLLLVYFKYIRGEKYEGDAIEQERKRGNY